MSGWAHRDPEAEDARARQTAVREIGKVFAGGPFASEIEMLLAIGGACPFAAWRDKAIWLEEFYLAAGQRGYYA